MRDPIVANTDKHTRTPKYINTCIQASAEILVHIHRSKTVSDVNYGISINRERTVAVGWFARLAPNEWPFKYIHTCCTTTNHQFSLKH